LTNDERAVNALLKLKVQGLESVNIVAGDYIQTSWCQVSLNLAIKVIFSDNNTLESLDI
jgi:hypothetical protein